MQLIENLRLAFTSLLANKMRALLTMLGIIIGISAVILESHKNWADKSPLQSLRLSAEYLKRQFKS